MLDVMSKQKKPDHAPAKGRGTVFGVRLGPEREAFLNRFVAAQKVKPDKTAVILAAFDEYMARELPLLPPEK